MSDNSETGVSEAAATAPVAASIPNTANIPAPSDFKRRSVRCDGSAHDGCQAGCLLFWKLAWLKAADAPADTLSIPSSSGYLWVFGDILRQELESDKPSEFSVLGLVDDTHPATTQLLNDAIVRDGLANHAQECYGGSVGKSMKAVELAISQKSGWRSIPITRIDRNTSFSPARYSFIGSRVFRSDLARTVRSRNLTGRFGSRKIIFFLYSFGDEGR